MPWGREILQSSSSSHSGCPQGTQFQLTPSSQNNDEDGEDNLSGSEIEEETAAAAAAGYGKI